MFESRDALQKSVGGVAPPGWPSLRPLGCPRSGGSCAHDGGAFRDILDAIDTLRTGTAVLSVEMACDPVDVPSRSHWPLDGSGVVVEDLGPSGFDGSAVAITSVPDGPMGGALEWNGTNARVIISDAGENDGQSPATPGWRR